MNFIWGGLGVLILLVVLGDVVRTTLSTNGAGFISGRLGDRLGAVALELHRRRPDHVLLSHMGSAILVMIIAVWTFLMWLGWTLFFLIDTDSVVLAANGEPVTALETLYFVGYTLITLGNGEYRPEGAFWQLATLLTSTTGFFVVTLAITYLLSVLPAVVEKRQLSATLASLGHLPEDILNHYWDGQDCQSLGRHLSRLTSSLNKVAEQHLALPVLHYFHSTDVRTALPLRVAALDEAMSYLLYGLESCRETAADVRPVRAATMNLLDTLQEGFIEASEQAPSPSPLSRLDGMNFKLRARKQYLTALERESVRRRLLRGYVAKDGWQWEDVFRT